MAASVSEIDERIRLFNLLVENARDYALFTQDREGRINSWNVGAERITGYTEQEALGQSGAILFTPEDRAKGAPEHEVETALAHGRAEDDRWHLRKNGSRFFASGVMTPLRGNTGELVGFAKILRDVTDQYEAQGALNRSQQRLEAALNVAHMAAWDWDPSTNTVTSTASIADVFGLSPGQTLETSDYCVELVHPEDRERLRALLEQAGRHGTGWHTEFRITRPIDGQLAWLEERATTTRDPATDQIRITALVWDITARKQAEEARLMVEREAALLHERNRMAQELHDTLAQGFTGIKLQTDVAEEALDADPPDLVEGLRHVRRAREIAVSSYEEARHSIQTLRAPLLDTGSLAAALEQMARETADGLAVTFTVEGAPIPLSGLVENDIYRVAQEALTNALRHSQAKQIRLTLTYTEETMQLTVQDEGCGFDPDRSRAGFGITGMRERAARLGATLQIDSRRGDGTTVVMTLRSVQPTPC